MKYVVVTGARGGMGKAVVDALKKEYFVFALDLSPAVENEETVLHLQADVTDEQSVAAAFEKVQEKTDEVFALLHFAVKLGRDDNGQTKFFVVGHAAQIGANFFQFVGTVPPVRFARFLFDQLDVIDNNNVGQVTAA